jgi:protein-L-isoaspartate(D-aspartate) O-methyltransferase
MTAAGILDPGRRMRTVAARRWHEQEPPEPFPALRETMVREQIQARGVLDPRVLEAMRAVPRHLFVPADMALESHADRPLPIGSGQTISQPYIVAAMAEALGLTGAERVLEVGSGSGYMAAVLSLLALEVRAVELEPGLQQKAAQVLARLGCSNVHLKCGDGRLGWPEHAPFDAILLSCAAPAIPPDLWDQLAMVGRIILPMGEPDATQELVVVRKTPAGSRVSRLMAVVFVPLRQGRDLPPD